MTGAYGAGDGPPEQDGDETAAPERAGADRPGPLPPRIVPPTGHAAVPGQPAGHPTAHLPGTPAAYPPGTAPTAAGATYGSAPGATWAPPPNSGQWGGAAAPTPRAPDGWPPAPPGAGPGEPTAPAPFAGQPAAAQAAPPAASPAPSAYPAYPGQPTPGPSYPAQPTPGPAYPAHPAPGPAYPSQPTSGPAYPGQPTSGPAYPGQPAGPVPAMPTGHPDRPGRGRRLPVVALVLAGILALVAGVQAYQIHRLDDRLAATDRRLAEAEGATAGRLDGLEGRAGALEKQAGAAFNPEAVASAVLPSVFRVRAGQFTGTAFAIGKAPAGGGTTLLTNFHVVESVFTAGDRKVFLERTDQRFEATIVEVDKDKDLAHLRTTAKFTGLVAAPTAVKSGQQIVVVGAPLGLQDSVTTGVVSAFRKDEGGSGPVIQFDAPINPGNSGGPVINGSKQVVGIATAKARDAEGIGLAVPIKTACDRFKLC
ncbi:trypsin-like peptidase domain-containing protein [Micromonospora chaiyaphumensis]|uniref:Trypsin-like peptidase domain-containing protein n=1 Tax=Micromonospora chaiyaphumensis TaxID=307119 RepID=A0A1C4Z7R3_9ACTN|nr:trypsin-like peptidase domain-containing protein [Micromonospora chaiyaphumensis]SCF29023.1 Trypsin-like peptidase domain-containing protein [Micromonospora chaiyaphumensis]